MRKRVLTESKLSAKNTVNGCTLRRAWNFSKRSMSTRKRLEITNSFLG